MHYYRAMLAAMGLPTSDGLDTSITPPSPWKDTGRALIGPGRFFGIAPGAAKGSAKQWPPDRFALAADGLSRELGAKAVLLGSEADQGAADYSRLGRFFLVALRSGAYSIAYSNNTIPVLYTR